MSEFKVSLRQHGLHKETPRVGGGALVELLDAPSCQSNTKKTSCILTLVFSINTTD